MTRLIEKTKIFYRSENLAELSRTCTRISSHANFRGWEVSDIIESGKGYEFEVTGDYSDEYLREESKMKSLLVSEEVEMEYVTPNEDDLISQAIYAVSEDMDANDILNKIMESEEKELTEDKNQPDSEATKKMYKFLRDIEGIEVEESGDSLEISFEGKTFKFESK